MKRKRLIIFMPSTEGGGVEKNLFIISRYLVKKIKDISLITVSNSYRKKFDKKIKRRPHTAAGSYTAWRPQHAYPPC